MDRLVVEAMQPYLTQKFYNPSATYLAAKSVREDLNVARRTVASLLGARPIEVIFTAGGTEANNQALIGILQAFPDSHVVTTALEHDSIRAPLEFMAERGWSQTEVVPKPDGLVEPSKVVAAITDKTVLVSVMYANNEIGTVQPIKRIATALQIIRKDRLQKGNNLPLYFHIDACQAPNYLDLHVHRLGVDLMTLNGGKIYGPKQSGVLFVASHVKLMPLVHGGGQEFNRRSGTENVAGIIGFTKALEIAVFKQKSESIRLSKLQNEFMKLLVSRISSVSINGSVKHRLPNNIHITIPDCDNERLVFGLDEAGILCSAGSACSASKDEPSHVLKAIGLSDVRAQSSLRFSMGRQTTSQDLSDTVRVLAKLVN